MFYALGVNGSPQGIFRRDLLGAIPAVEETAYIRHIRLPKPVQIKMDGLRQIGVVTQAEGGSRMHKL